MMKKKNGRKRSRRVKTRVSRRRRMGKREIRSGRSSRG
jgi:hypothetical protein